MAGKVITPRTIVKESLEEVLAKEKGKGPKKSTQRAPKQKMGGIAHRVRIIHLRDCCKVVPAVQHARPGDTITWQVIGRAKSVQLFFPNVQLFGTQVHRIPVRRTGTKNLPMQKGIRMGKYPYAVYCEAHKRFAVGNSDPRIDYP